MDESERLLRHFNSGEADPTFSPISYDFKSLATSVMSTVASGPDRDYCMARLLEARTAAIRGQAHPGG